MEVPGKGGRPIGLAKTGGRKKGTPNRATLTLVEALNAMACDPLLELAKIAMNPKTSIEIRVRCFSEIAPYVHPKRKPVEISIEQPTVINVNTNLDESGHPRERGSVESSNDESAGIDVDTNLQRSDEPGDDGESQS